MIVYWLNFTVLLGTAIIASVAIYSNAFKDNFIQRVGLCLVAMTFFGRVNDLLDGQNSFDFELLFFWKNAGVFLFALGTVIKFSMPNFFIFGSNSLHQRRKDDVINQKGTYEN